MVVAGSPDQGNQVGISLDRQALKGKAHSGLHLHLQRLHKSKNPTQRAFKRLMGTFGGGLALGGGLAFGGGLALGGGGLCGGGGLA